MHDGNMPREVEFLEQPFTPTQLLTLVLQMLADAHGHDRLTR